jgi:type VII secretion-associated serine protease mycosin
MRDQSRIGVAAGLCLGLISAGLLAAAPVRAASGVLPQAPKAPAGVCNGPVPPGQAIPALPWAQRLIGPDRIWPFTRGGGVKVAVLDSGVEASHPQLAGKVLPGFDFIRNVAGADFDCNGHGTAVASIIAARHVDGVGFQGLAPDVTIIPVRVSEREPGQSGASVNGVTLAKAINYAVTAGAKVINMSFTLDADDPVVHAAIDSATAADVTLVAAVGNAHSDTAGETGDPATYPAAYNGVIGVGDISENGQRDTKSNVGSYVDLMAPGDTVVAAAAGGGQNYFTGTSFATPVVSAAAALLRSRQPNLHASAVAQRLRATADPAPGGTDSREYGHGIVDPYRAILDGLVPGTPSPAGPLAVPAVDPAAQARAQRWYHSGQLALGVGGGALGLVILIAIAAAARRQGRKRGWAVRRATPPPKPPPIAEPQEIFFSVPGANRTE